MTRPALVALVALLLVACGGDDQSDGADSGQTSEQSDTAEGSMDSETGETDPACFPAGPYGKCSDNLCQCVLGGDLYQTCTKSCTETSECGDPADFPGATPDCAPVNVGDPDNICMLRCATTADCPCGLECQSTYLICTEPQP